MAFNSVVFARVFPKCRIWDRCDLRKSLIYLQSWNCKKQTVLFCFSLFFSLCVLNDSIDWYKSQRPGVSTQWPSGYKLMTPLLITNVYRGPDSCFKIVLKE